MIQTMNSTDIRKDWMAAVNTMVMEKPQFFKRSRYIFLSDLNFMEELLEGYSYTAIRMDEDDKSVTLALNELDLVENGLMHS